MSDFLSSGAASGTGRFGFALRRWHLIVGVIILWNLLSLLRIAATATDPSLPSGAIASAVRVLLLDDNSWALVSIAAVVLTRLVFPDGPVLDWRRVVLVIALGVAIVTIRFWVTFTIANSQGWIPNPPTLRRLLTLLPTNIMFFIGLVATAVTWQLYQERWHRQAEEAQMRAELTTARLEALRLQLNPHFLFNALNTIAGLIPQDQVAAEDAVTSLGRLLRTSLAARGHEVTLGEERRSLEAYVHLAQLRFREWLTVTVDIPERLESALVPPLLLQPLVENAIRHGIAPSMRTGEVRVAVRELDGKLVLSVTDDGIGLTEKPPVGSGPHGIGLTNVAARLRQLYGAGADLQLRDNPTSGASAVVSLPLRWHGGPVSTASRADGHSRSWPDVS